MNNVTVNVTGTPPRAGPSSSRGPRSPPGAPARRGRRSPRVRNVNTEPLHRQRSRGWCGTLNNYVEADVDNFRHLESSAGVQTLICSREVGASGTPHLQFYIEFFNQISFRALKARLGDRVHLEVRRGTPLQAFEYCEKEGSEVLFSKGRPTATSHPGQGARTDLSAIADEIVNGADLLDLAMRYPRHYILHSRGMATLRSTVQAAQASQTRPVKVHVYFGESGRGKTYVAKQKAEDACRRHGLEPNSKNIFVWKPTQGSWYDGYDGQRVVIIDEFRGTIPFGELITIIDPMHVRVQVKGSFAFWRPTHIFITSPISPELWYRNLDMSIDGRAGQLWRRISSIAKVINSSDLQHENELGFARTKHHVMRTLRLHRRFTYYHYINDIPPDFDWRGGLSDSDEEDEPDVVVLPEDPFYPA
jgi:hypothetical protein